MYIIAHRGVFDPKQIENHPDSIQRTLDRGFEVEVDVWLDNYGVLRLGHDRPKWEVKTAFLKNNSIWVHAKNIETFHYLLPYSEINSFYQEDEPVAMTRFGYAWHHVNNTEYGTRSIAMILDPPHQINLDIAGVCTNNPVKLQHLIGLYETFELLIIDVDGVMSRGKIYDGGTSVYKEFCDLDFTAIKRFKAGGIKVCFCSSDKSNEALAKARNIDFWHVPPVDGIIDKSTRLDEMCKFYNTHPDRVAYVGDDYYDIPMFNLVGYSFCPSNSPIDVKEATFEILKSGSGEGCIAEIFDDFRHLIDLKYPYDNL